MRHKLLRVMPVYAVAVLCLIWVFHGIDLRQLKTNLAAVSWPFLCLAAVLNLSVYVANAWRWKLALQPVDCVPYGRSLRATYIGVFLNEALPLRPGEIIRSVLLSRWVRAIDLTVAVSSTIIERLTEAVWMALGFVIVMLVVPVPTSLIYAFAIMSLALVCASIFWLWQSGGTGTSAYLEKKVESSRLGAGFWQGFDCWHKCPPFPSYLHVRCCRFF